MLRRGRRAHAPQRESRFIPGHDSFPVLFNTGVLVQRWAMQLSGLDAHCPNGSRPALIVSALMLGRIDVSDMPPAFTVCGGNYVLCSFLQLISVTVRGERLTAGDSSRLANGATEISRRKKFGPRKGRRVGRQISQR